MTPMVFAATDFGLSFILEWVALAIIVVIVVRNFPIPQLGRMMSARMEAIHAQLVAGEKARRDATPWEDSTFVSTPAFTAP